MKVNKAISLSFTTTNKSTANINVNFPVKSIHIKSAGFTEDAIGTNGELYLTLTSDLTNGEPMAMMYSNSTYPAQQFCDISFQPYKPFIVNGTYNFTLLAPDGGSFSPAGTEIVSLILEFNGVDTVDT